MIQVDAPTLDTFLDQQRQALCLPGLAVAVVQDGRIAYLRGIGNASPERPMTPETPLIIGSVSKSITALAIMQLVEAGKINLDAPVQRYIPWFCLADTDAAAYITIRDLLTHTSGISRYSGRELLGGRGDKTLEQIVRELRNLRLTAPVGSVFQYSNINYLIAGRVIEEVSAQPFGVYIQEHIFNPLGMKHSHTSEDAAQHDGLACGHRWWFGVPRPFHAPYLPDAVPAAFVAASIEDIACYALALLNGGELDGVSVLSPASVATLHRAQVATDSTGSSYALGWRVEQLAGLSVVRHGGVVSNFLAEIVLLPELGAGVIVLMNANNGLASRTVPPTSHLASEVVHLLSKHASASSPPLFPRFLCLAGYRAGSAFRVSDLVGG